MNITNQNILFLRETLDFLVDPKIEENMACTLDCCFANNVLPRIEKAIDEDSALHALLGDTEIKDLKQLITHLDDLIDTIFMDEHDWRGFSNDAPWRAFVTRAHQIKTLILQKLNKGHHQ